MVKNVKIAQDHRGYPQGWDTSVTRFTVGFSSLRCEKVCKTRLNLTRNPSFNAVLQGGFNIVALLRCVSQECLLPFWASRVVCAESSTGAGINNCDRMNERAGCGPRDGNNCQQRCRNGHHFAHIINDQMDDGRTPLCATRVLHRGIWGDSPFVYPIGCSFLSGRAE